MWSLWCMWGACACCHGHLVALAFLLYAPRRYTLCTHLYNVSTNFKTCKFSEVLFLLENLAFFVILQSQWWWTIYLVSHIYHTLMMQQGFLAYKWVNFSKEFLMHMREIFSILSVFSQEPAAVHRYMQWLVGRFLDSSQGIGHHRTNF